MGVLYPLLGCWSETVFVHTAVPDVYQGKLEGVGFCSAVSMEFRSAQRMALSVEL